MLIKDCEKFTAVPQLTEEQSREYYEREEWEDLTDRERAEFQLLQKRLCMPWRIFHEAMETTIGRSITIPEFARNYEGLVEELFGEREKENRR